MARKRISEQSDAQQLRQQYNLAAIGCGIEDMKAGRVMTLEESQNRTKAAITSQTR